MTTLSDGPRQSDRVRFRMPVEVSWLTSAGVTVAHNAETLLVSRNGGVLRLAEKLSMGQELHLRRDLEGDNWKKIRAPTSGTSTSPRRTKPRKLSLVFSWNAASASAAKSSISTSCS